jgi:hypothetical protein
MRSQWCQHPEANRHTPTSSSTNATEQTPEHLEQLARSVAMSGVLGDRDRLDVVIALRRLAEIDKASKRHPSNRRTPATD